MPHADTNKTSKQHKCSQGCSGRTCSVKKEKKIRLNLQRKFVSAPPAHQVPPGRARVNFCRTLFAGWGDFLGWSGLFCSFRPSFEGDD